MVNKAVILAAGRGTRMRSEAPGVTLQAEQQRVAEQGLKGLIPFHGHPFLDYVISAAADAGLTEVCLVVGPSSAAIREHYRRVPTERVRIAFAEQREPLGTADAVLAAAAFVGDDPFLVLNSDNYYPPGVLAALRPLAGHGMAGFSPDILASQGNIPAERVAGYALVTTDAEGNLVEIVEKPGPALIEGAGAAAWISMTCWRFLPSIFVACRAIGRSPRGEYELPDAVLHSVRRQGEPIEVVPVFEPVLDLSTREDIPAVAQRLRGRTVNL